MKRKNHKASAKRGRRWERRLRRDCADFPDEIPPQAPRRGAAGAGSGKAPMLYSESPSAKLRSFPQSSGTFITWSEMQPASCRFSKKDRLSSRSLAARDGDGAEPTGLALAQPVFRVLLRHDPRRRLPHPERKTRPPPLPPSKSSKMDITQ